MKIKRFFPLLLAGALSISVTANVSASSAQEELADAQAEKAWAESLLAQEEANMASLESKKQELENYLWELNQQYEELTASVSELGIQAAEKEEQLKVLEQNLEEARAASEKQYEDMKKRIVYMYENGSASMLELLLSSQDLTQFLNRADNIAQISKYDRDMLEKYKALQNEIKAQEETAEAEAAAVNALLAEKSAKQREVKELTASTSENIQSYIYQISSSQEEIQALSTQIYNADNSIYTLLQAVEAEQAALNAAEENSSYGENADEVYEDSYESSYDDNYASDYEESYVESDTSYEDTDQSSGNTSASTSSESGTYLGNFTLTAYCNCAQCCGTAGNLTASGTVPTAGRTVAMAGVPFGTQLLINGTVYTVEDLGTPYGHVDIFFNSHSDALMFGRQSAEVYQVN